MGNPTDVVQLGTGHHVAAGAIFDRYNIINEQELLEAGDQLVVYLAHLSPLESTRFVEK